MGYLVFFFILVASGVANSESLRLATSTSTDNSGLLAELHPPFERRYGVRIDVIAVGSGKALRLGENGDVDVLMVHAPAAEISFVKQGFGIERLSLMHNDFIVLGPLQDPAGLAQIKRLDEVMNVLSVSGSTFISRGDNSGTHQKEMALWQSVGIEPQGNWYMAVGQNMGAVLQIANDKLAYTLSDRGTYLAQKNRLQLVPLFSGDRLLFNPYHVIIVNPLRHPHVKLELAKKYVDFIRGVEGQAIIRGFRQGSESLFKPDVVE